MGCGPAETDDAMRISEALRVRPTGPVRVQGFLVQTTADELRLCAELLESYPPQCGEPSLRVEGLDPDTVQGVHREGSARWTDREVELAGMLEGDTLRVRR